MWVSVARDDFRERVHHWPLIWIWKRKVFPCSNVLCPVVVHDITAKEKDVWPPAHNSKEKLLQLPSDSDQSKELKATNLWPDYTYNTCILTTMPTCIIHTFWILPHSRMSGCTSIPVVWLWDLDLPKWKCQTTTAGARDVGSCLLQGAQGLPVG